MAAKRGSTLLLQYNTGTYGSPTWSTLGGLRARQIRKGRTMIDVTTADSSELARVLLEGGGVWSMTISGDGVFEDTAAQDAMNTANDDGSFLDVLLTIPDYGTYRGYVQVPELGFDGSHDGELKYSCSLESTGVHTFAGA